MADKWGVRVSGTQYQLASQMSKAQIYTKHLEIGIGVTIDRNATIGTPIHPCETVYIGDHTHIGPNTYIQSPHISIGDYTKIHRNSLIYGRNPITLGHNVWIGEGSIIDAEGHTTIGNNVGIGAHSQLWSHIRHGDVMMGCKYLSYGTLDVKDDVWFVGHCIVNPITAQPFSMAMVGSMVTKDMEYNHVYGGSPAIDLTEKLGYPYEFTPPEQRFVLMQEKIEAFLVGYRKQSPCDPDFLGRLQVVNRWDSAKYVFRPGELDDPSTTYFDVFSRSYTKKRTALEIEFMKFLLPEVKFLPQLT